MVRRAISFAAGSGLAIIIAAQLIADSAQAQCSTITGPGMPSGGPCPQQRHYSAPSGGTVRYYGGGGGGGSGGYNYGAAIGAAGAVIEAAPAAINLLGGVLSTGADIVSGVASTGGNMINSGADALSNAVPSQPTGSGLSLPNPFKLLNPETAEASDDAPICLKQARFTGSHGQYRPINACNEPVTLRYKTSERSYETNIRSGDLVFTEEGQTVKKKGPGEMVWSNGGRPLLMSVCNSQHKCYYPSNTEAVSDRRQTDTAARSSPVRQPKKQKTVEVKKPAAENQATPDTPMADVVRDLFKSMPNADR